MEKIVLDACITEQGRSYRVTFRNEDQALAFIAARTTTHTFSEVEDKLIDFGAPDAWKNVKLSAVLYPSCEHGMSLDLCAGPQHYPYDADELAHYGYR